MSKRAILKAFRLYEDDLLKLERISKKLGKNKSEVVRYMIRQTYLIHFDKRVKELSKIVDKVIEEVGKSIEETKKQVRLE